MPTVSGIGYAKSADIVKWIGKRINNMKEKYRIMHDFISEGFVFYTGGNKEIQEYETIEDAVKSAIEASYSAKFIIVKVVEWEAKEIS